MFNNIKLKYADLYTELCYALGYEGILKKMLVEETRKRFGSIENFLRECGFGEKIDKLKKEMM